MSPNCDLDLEDYNLLFLFLHDPPTYDDVSDHQTKFAWLHVFWVVQEILSG